MPGTLQHEAGEQPDVLFIVYYQNARHRTDVGRMIRAFESPRP
jgi:hypothetical protein